MSNRRFTIGASLRLLRSIVGAFVLLLPSSALCQLPEIRYGSEVPPEVKMMYERGLEYLARTQQDSGSWAGGQSGSGITGMCLMAFLANGEDPNFGRYQVQIQRAVRSIIREQNASTGYISQSMYHHGFAMLALAEAYGTVDETLLWDGQAGVRGGGQRSIGAALELAVRCAVTSQKRNQFGAWRYSPETTDADTSVSGAVLVGLLAARNAGIEVPDESIDKALAYYQSMTAANGGVGYSGGPASGGSMNPPAIATLVYSIGKRKDSTQFAATSKYIVSNMLNAQNSYPEYYRYYMSQALFQSDFEAWGKWKRENTATLRALQQEDGSFNSSYGQAYATSMSLLSLALDYRFLPIYER
jgi:hypothetical protein